MANVDEVLVRILLSSILRNNKNRQNKIGKFTSPHLLQTGSYKNILLLDSQARDFEYEIPFGNIKIRIYQGSKG
jgi:hypothetical protein